MEKVRTPPCLRPDEPRALEEWDGFTYVPAGTADNLAAAQAWANGTDPGTKDAEE
ncbi:DUF6087 family protein [Streptomyces sp. NBC_01236]|nr:DUF6087 family protein [Streptomyces sp. NBC_01236]